MKRAYIIKGILNESLGANAPWLLKEKVNGTRSFVFCSCKLKTDPFLSMIQKWSDNNPKLDVSNIRLELAQDIPRLKRDTTMTVDVLKNGDTVLSFIPLSEIAFKKTEENIVVPMPQTRGLPLLTLVFPDRSEDILFRHAGSICNQSLFFSPYVNTLLRENNGIRNAICSILDVFGEEQEILAEIAKTIREDTCFLIPFPMDEFLRYQSGDELLEQYNWVGIDYDETMTLNQAFYLVRMAVMVREEDWETLGDFCRSSKDYYITDEIKMSTDPDPARFLTSFVQNRRPRKEYSETYEKMQRYISCCLEQEELISLQEIVEL